MTCEGVPLLDGKDYAAPSLFEPANLLREARRQKDLPEIAVPRVAVLEPDGDIVRYLAADVRCRRHPGWARYHTDMWTVDLDGIEIGVVGMAVGASFVVLVAEQFAASGAELVISITSAGAITALPHTPCFLLIDRALRDEGTSLHYQPPDRWSHLDTTLRDTLAGAFAHLSHPVLTPPRLANPGGRPPEERTPTEPPRRPGRDDPGFRWRWCGEARDRSRRRTPGGRVRVLAAGRRPDVPDVSGTARKTRPVSTGAWCVCCR